MRTEEPRPRILGAVDAMAEAHQALARSSRSVDIASIDVAAAATASSIGSTRAGAPPCSGPESAPTADESAAAQSAPVDATTRAVNVEALSPCSAVQIQ